MIGVGVAHLKHALPRTGNSRVELSLPGRAAAPDPRIEVFGQAYFTDVQPLEDIGVLVHFADSVPSLVLLVFTHLQLDDRMDGDVGHDMAGVAQQPRKRLLLRRTVELSDQVDARFDHVAGFLVVHAVSPLTRIGMGNIEIRIVRADGPELAKAEVVEYRNNGFGREAMAFKAGRLPDQIDQRQVCVGTRH